MLRRLLGSLMMYCDVSEQIAVKHLDSGGAFAADPRRRLLHRCRRGYGRRCSCTRNVHIPHGDQLAAKIAARPWYGYVTAAFSTMDLQLTIIERGAVTWCGGSVGLIRCRAAARSVGCCALPKHVVSDDAQLFRARGCQLAVDDSRPRTRHINDYRWGRGAGSMACSGRVGPSVASAAGRLRDCRRRGSLRHVQHTALSDGLNSLDISPGNHSCSGPACKALQPALAAAT